MLESLRQLNESLRRANAPERLRALRGPRQQSERVKWHGAIFAYAYTQSHGIVPQKMWARMEPQDSSHDMTMNWPFIGGRELRVQLKELPPRKLNRKLSTQQLVDKAVAQYPHDADMVLAFFLNRTEHFTTVRLPVRHGVAGIWFYGFSKPGGQEVFIKGMDDQGEREGYVPFLVPRTA